MRLLVVLLGFEHLARPEGGLLGGIVEIRRFIKNGVIVIAEHAPFGLFDDQIEALPRVGPVTDDVAEAVNRLDAAVRLYPPAPSSTPLRFECISLITANITCPEKDSPYLYVKVI